MPHEAELRRNRPGADHAIDSTSAERKKQDSAFSQRARKVGALLAGIAILFCPIAARAQAISPDALVQAYPDQIAGRDDDAIIFRDGTRQNLSDGRTDKSFDEKLKNASLLDQLSLAYPKGALTKPPGPQDDPGRFRNAAFFDKMYGDCDKGETQKALTDIPWFTGKVRVTTVNGVAERLRAVAKEIERLPKDIKRNAYPSAGAFNCRMVKDTGKRSMHAYGAAIDLNTAFSDYWLWRKGGYRNRIPYEIVEIFERHGFIWGGKWGHFDTMHFEYRPEFFVPLGGDEKKQHGH
ncbi:MAG: M15 family metallopeptidase [Methylocystis sp.]|uniref:M15 family metallopeptidase n=1 Tax=Methylocystis sp. TaxID=1911079 RepID=UPI003963BF3F